TSGRILLPNILPVYHQLYPNVELNIKFSSHENLSNMLSTGEIDLMIGMYTKVEADFIEMIIHSTRLCLLVPHNIMNECFPNKTRDEHNNLIKQKLINIQDFENAPFILHFKGNILRNLCDRYFHKSDFSPKVIVETNDLAVLHELCKKGMVITCTFEMTSKNLDGSLYTNEDDHLQDFYIIPINYKEVMNHFMIG